MSSTDLCKPFTIGGILNINFVNGRLLTAEDMSALQSSNAQQHQQLAKASGEGVAYGFEASPAPSSLPNSPVLRVTRGLAFNRKGQAAALSTDYVDVALVKSADVQASSTGLFAECPPPQPLQQNTNLGLYVLTVAPTSSYQGSVSTVDLNSTGMASSCSSRYLAEGVKFQLDPLQIGGGDPTTVRGQLAALATQLEPLLATLANLPAAQQGAFAIQIAAPLSKFRNLAAHFCFGTETLTTFPASIFPGTGASFPASYGALDDIRSAGLLTDCEVPLALVYWASSGMVFLDAWAVRRTLIAPPTSAKWAPLVSPRRLSEGWAMFLQFQKQVGDLVSILPQAQLATAVATDYFRYLPAAGIIPITGILNSTGIDYLTFLQANTYRKPEYLEGARLRSLLMEALEYPAVDLSDEVMVWLYRVRENMQTINTNLITTPNAYIVFASGHVPNYGIPHYDVNRWDYSTYA